ncbi:MAG TPA: LLM class F420-dependent oxidoreductase [Acetobacteraceae bacterium]|jgi:probable F420-dependent oxidoreductase|nr:LLM class F420-dependent oxidoreductase [Acetobacteraceae bacterium]
MKFGLRYCNTGRFTDPTRAVELVQAGEAAGFESAWTVEHTVIPRGYQSAYPYTADGKLPGGEGDFVLPDPLIWMAYVAAATMRIHLATGILILAQHNPVVCAKQVATLDAMSGGRVLLGIGVGWLKEEFEAIGVPFEDRGRRTDEYIAAMRALWSQDVPTHHGEFVNFTDAFMRPKPVHRAVPIIIGGQTPPAARRAGRLAQGFFPGRGVPRDLIELARRTATTHDRNPADIEITVSIPDDLDEIPRLAEFGVGRVLVPVTGVAGLHGVIRGAEDVLKWRDVIDRYADV